ncbi:MAG: GreA/GreB family elongation factor [Myxococcaceae bacterium]
MAKKALSKKDLKAELVEQLTAALHALEQAQKATVAGATHAEAKPENDKDTRALEQQYLARGQAMRVEELRLGLIELNSMTTRAFKDDEQITLGALVTVEENEKQTKMLVAPQGGGSRLAKGTIQVVTPRSPLGEAIAGKICGDDIEVSIGGKMRSMEIVEVE